MSVYHLVAQLPNGGQKSMFNRSHEYAIEHVHEFLRDGTITTRWGNNLRTRQCYELRAYETSEPYSRKTSGPFAEFIRGKRNIYPRLEREAKSRLPQRRTRVFVVTPIQGDRYGTQSEQNVYKEYNERFAAIETALEAFDCVAIRIDKEAPLGGLVTRIKEEIRRAQFIVADLTDERPSCYFEVGYAEALNKPILFVASRESVVDPGTDTKIHFDIHQNVQFFTNHEELIEKLRAAITANRERLLSDEDRTMEGLLSLITQRAFSPPESA